MYIGAYPEHSPRVRVLVGLSLPFSDIAVDCKKSCSYCICMRTKIDNLCGSHIPTNFGLDFVGQCSRYSPIFIEIKSSLIKTYEEKITANRLGVGIMPGAAFKKFACTEEFLVHQLPTLHRNSKQQKIDRKSERNVLTSDGEIFLLTATQQSNFREKHFHLVPLPPRCQRSQSCQEFSIVVSECRWWLLFLSNFLASYRTNSIRPGSTRLSSIVNVICLCEGWQCTHESIRCCILNRIKPRRGQYHSTTYQLRYYTGNASWLIV